MVFLCVIARGSRVEGPGESYAIGFLDGRAAAMTSTGTPFFADASPPAAAPAIPYALPLGGTSPPDQRLDALASIAVTPDDYIPSLSTPQTFAQTLVDKLCQPVAPPERSSVGSSVI
jgi:hypothetical protein